MLTGPISQNRLHYELFFKSFFDDPSINGGPCTSVIEYDIGQHRMMPLRKLLKQLNISTPKQWNPAAGNSSSTKASGQGITHLANDLVQ